MQKLVLAVSKSLLAFCAESLSIDPHAVHRRVSHYSLSLEVSLCLIYLRLRLHAQSMIFACQRLISYHVIVKSRLLLRLLLRKNRPI